eukprot:SAG25_NODE_224_length_11578_cov_10.606325_7_plen_386_part_00
MRRVTLPRSGNVTRQRFMPTARRKQRGGSSSGGMKRPSSSSPGRSRSRSRSRSASARRQRHPAGSPQPAGTTRWWMVGLCFGARGVGQANRILLGAVMPVMVAELGFGTVDKGKLLGAFASGYALTQLIGGIAADRVGSKYILLLALLAVSLGSITAAFLGAPGGSIGALWTCYFLMGLLEGPSYPALGSMLGQWFPKNEKARAASAADTGGSIGGLLALGAGPIIAASFGWRAALLGCGVVSLAFCGVWLACCADRPANCGWLSADEKRYLRDSGVAVTATAAANAKTPGRGGAAPRSFPFQLFTNAPVLAVCYAHVIFNFARYILYGWIPSFFIDELKLSSTTAGVCMTCLQLSDAFTKLLVGSVADSAAAVASFLAAVLTEI